MTPSVPPVEPLAVAVRDRTSVGPLAPGTDHTPHAVPALGFALSWYRSELTEVCSRRISYRSHGHLGWRRPLWLALVALYALLFATVGALLAWVNHLPLLAGVALVILGALVGIAVVLGGFVLVTALTVRRASAVVWIDDHRGRAGLLARPRGDGSWGIYCVHAHPTGSGLGTEIMNRITALADARHIRLYLVASHPDAARFYSRHGFTPRVLGSMRMDRRLDESVAKRDTSA